MNKIMIANVPRCVVILILAVLRSRLTILVLKVFLIAREPFGTGAITIRSDAVNFSMCRLVTGMVLSSFHWFSLMRMVLVIMIAGAPQNFIPLCFTRATKILLSYLFCGWSLWPEALHLQAAVMPCSSLQESSFVDSCASFFGSFVIS